MLDGIAIGCIRFSVDLSETALRTFYGGIGFAGMDAWPREIWSVAVASRWVVATEHRSLALAQRLAAGVIALGGYLGVPAVHAAVGTRLGQDRILMRTGAIAALGFGGLIPVPRFNDRVYIMKIDLGRPRAGFVGVIDIMRNRLAAEFTFMDDRTATRAKNGFERIAA